MKRYILGLTFATACAFSLSSCSDFLEEPILGQQGMDNYFTTEEECAKQVIGCYQGIACDDWWQIYKFYNASEMCTDDAWMGNTTQDAGDYRHLTMYTGNTIEAGNACQNFWQYRYKGILQCNIAIQKIPGLTFNNETYKQRLLGEAKFLRAYQYFELVRNFGGVPLIKELKMPNEIKGITRASVADSYAMIEQDLLDAIAVLPLRSTQSSADIGRVTKGAALGLLAKVYLYQEKYKEAEAQLQAVINSNEYKLLPNFGDVWSMDHNNSEESLFEIQTSGEISYNLGQRYSVIVGSRDDSGWSWGLPSSYLEKAFKDEGDDIRLLWTILHHNQTYVPNDNTWSATNPYIITPSKHKSARCNMKLYIPMAKRVKPYDAPHVALNYRLLRYADILLMYAEVENQLGKDTEAQQALNQVRKRVNLANVTATGKLLRDAIRKERRLELAFENNRLYDLRRWKDDNGKAAICNVMGPNGSWVIYNTKTSTDQYEKSNQNESSSEGSAFTEGRDELFPIPNSEIILSGGSIKQNPGYN